MGVPHGGVPGLPGLGADIAPPAFVQEQQAQEAARQRAAAAQARQQAIAQAAAADPFASAYAAPAAPQEVRLVFDDKPVDDKEVGRNKTGNLIAIVATAVVSLGAGWGIGGLVTTRGQNESALRAVGEIRTEVARVSTIVGTAKTKIDHAMEAGNIRVTREGDDPSAPAPASTHPPTVDEELLAWIREQPPEVPFTPAVFAGRAGRLNAALVGKLTLLSLQIAQLWDQMITHGRRTNVPQTNESIARMNPATSDLARTYVVFPTAGPPTLAVAAGSADAAGNVTFPSAANQPAVTRAVFNGQTPLAPSALPSTAIPIRPPTMLINAGSARWREYSDRVKDLKAIVEELSGTVDQLTQLLNQGAGAR